MTDAAGLRAAGALHCNLNVRTLAGASGVYEALGLRVTMQSRAEGQDASAMGLGQATDSEAWFLYDGRGGRRAPAVELVEWLEPKTAGNAYAHPGEVGMQALGFDVPDLDAAIAAVTAQGARVRPGGPDGVDAVVLDADGVALELRGAAVESSVLRYARIVCADLERSSEWYARLGFDPLGHEAPLQWHHAGKATTVSELRLALAGPPPLELRLTGWGSHPTAPAHGQANDRGLFRMALAVPDVRAAVAAARQSGGIDASEASFIPLPGTRLGGLWVSFFRDPDGVMVEYVERSLGS
ncbi:MAG TPA: VOC family protein [Acidimicrobiales bacterium]|jgi:catechol 2,3-dioxygenase-like lactoylglutathione lyase family enzyme